MLKIKQKQHQTYKYRILELLNKLPHNEYLIAKNRLPIAINVSPTTFHDWKYIKEGSGRRIPAEDLYQIASFFDLSVKEMFTTPPKGINYEQLKKDYYETTAGSFNLKNKENASSKS